MRHLTPPWPYRTELYGGEDPTDFCLRELERTIDELGPDNIAAMIGEPIMGVAGMLVPPDDYWPRVHALLREHGILLILDEVVTAYGRTGEWFAAQHFGIEPDIIVTAKGITSGYLPLGAVLISDAVADVARSEGLPVAFTYCGHPTACAVALANLDIIEREGLLEQRARVGGYLLDRLSRADRAADRRRGARRRHDARARAGQRQGDARAAADGRRAARRDPPRDRRDRARRRHHARALAAAGDDARGGRRGRGGDRGGARTDGHGREDRRMRAARITAFGAPLEVGDVPDPTPGPTDVVIKMEAAGICRSDWHAWNGDWDWVGLQPGAAVTPGHEIGGVVEEVGRDVRSLRPGDRVTVPFHEGCGHCVWCRQGRTNLCDNLEFIGFTHDGGYAEYAVAYNADYNVIKLPDSVDSMAAAAIGCRYMTAFHAVMHQGATRPGDWVAVHGAGGVGLSAMQIASAIGAQVDRHRHRRREAGQGERRRRRAHRRWARTTTCRSAIREISKGGVRVSIVALGRSEMVLNSIHSLVKGGRHVQVGLTSQEEQGMVAAADRPDDRARARVHGQHGQPAHALPEPALRWWSAAGPTRAR